MKISEIRPRMDAVIVEGQITNISKPEEVETRFGLAMHAKATLSDETDSIRLNLWRDQITKVSLGCRVRIENGFTKFGELNVGSGGRIVVLDRGTE